MRTIALLLAACAASCTASPTQGTNHERADAAAPTQPAAGPALHSPPSAADALDRVLTLLRDSEDEHAQLVIRRLAAKALPAPPNAWSQVEVTVDLTYHAPDEVDATRALDAAVDAAEAQPWCVDVKRTGTSTLAEGTGVYTDGLTFRVSGDPTQPEGTAGEVELLCRSLAQRDGIELGSIDILRSTTRPAEHVEDERYRVRPSDRRRPLPLGAVLAYADALEQHDRRGVVTRLEAKPVRRASPAGPAPTGWTFDATLTVRSRVN
ncbi:MAG: hypothetical protein AAF682_14125 [Planctomycetota bacterium]